MKLMGNLVWIIMIVTILLGQSGCSMIAGHLALAAGKKVYHEIEDDSAPNEQASQE